MSEGEEWKKDGGGSLDSFKAMLAKGDERRKKHNKMVEASIFEYNQKLFLQDQALHDAASDQASYDVAISARLRSEIKATDFVANVPGNLQSMVLRQVAENLMHKAGCNDRMREMSKGG